MNSQQDKLKLLDAMCRGSGRSNAHPRNADGLVDLTGVHLLAPQVAATHRIGQQRYQELVSVDMIRGAIFDRVDFSRSVLPSLRLRECQFRGCRFDETRVEDLRAWDCEFAETSFRKTRLRGAALGGQIAGRGNRFSACHFDRADMTDTSYGAAEFVDCTFVKNRIAKVDFEGVVFRRCKIEGLLKEVLFYRHGFRRESAEPNDMEECDFSEAVLRHVQFRGMDLASMTFPVGPEHFLVRDYRAALIRVIAKLTDSQEEKDRLIRMNLGFCLKWAGEKQQIGVFNRDDLADAFGSDGARRVESLLGGDRIG